MKRGDIFRVRFDGCSLVQFIQFRRIHIYEGVRDDRFLRIYTDSIKIRFLAKDGGNPFYGVSCWPLDEDCLHMKPIPVRDLPLYLMNMKHVGGVFLRILKKAY